MNNMSQTQPAVRIGFIQPELVGKCREHLRDFGDAGCLLSRDPKISSRTEALAKFVEVNRGSIVVEEAKGIKHLT